MTHVIPHCNYKTLSELNGTENLNMWCVKAFFFALVLRPDAGFGLLILVVFYITHNDTPQSVGLLWASDKLVAETST
jgi:hypothetical protein